MSRVDTRKDRTSRFYAYSSFAGVALLAVSSTVVSPIGKTNELAIKSETVYVAFTTSVSSFRRLNASTNKYGTQDLCET